jgi:hypothetical protein
VFEVVLLGRPRQFRAGPDYSGRFQGQTLRTRGQRVRISPCQRALNPGIAMASGLYDLKGSVEPPHPYSLDSHLGYHVTSIVLLGHKQRVLAPDKQKG